MLFISIVWRLAFAAWFRLLVAMEFALFPPNPGSMLWKNDFSPPSFYSSFSKVPESPRVGSGQTLTTVSGGICRSPEERGAERGISRGGFYWERAGSGRWGGEVCYGVSPPVLTCVANQSLTAPPLCPYEWGGLDLCVVDLSILMIVERSPRWLWYSGPTTEMPEHETHEHEHSVSSSDCLAICPWTQMFGDSFSTLSKV